MREEKKGGREGGREEKRGKDRQTCRAAEAADSERCRGRCRRGGGGRPKSSRTLHPGTRAVGLDRDSRSSQVHFFVLLKWSVKSEEHVLADDSKPFHLTDD